MLVKPAVLKLGLTRSKEINRERREALNLLILRQHYLNRKIKMGEAGKLGELKTVHLLIEQWYTRESEKVQHQSRVREFQSYEQTSIYHHELHKKMPRRTATLKLQTEAGISVVVGSRLHGNMDPQVSWEDIRPIPEQRQRSTCYVKQDLMGQQLYLKIS